MNIHMAKKWPEMVVKRSYIKGHSFPYRLYVVPVKSTMEISKNFVAFSEYMNFKYLEFFLCRDGERSKNE